MIKKITAIACSILMASASIVSAEGDNQDRIDFFRQLHMDRGQAWFSQAPVASSYTKLTRNRRGQPDRTHVVNNLVAQTRATMGEEWVKTALKIARVESGYNCGAQGPRLREGDRAMGVGQVRLRSARALGYTGTAAQLLDCATGIKMMLAHMERCRTEGATTETLMARCHVAGWRGFKGRLNARAHRYAGQYQNMVRTAALPSIPDSAGWLVRGTTSTYAVALN